MNIVQLPNPILRTKCPPVKKITPEIIHLIKDMKTTLNNQKNPGGVGLAAPQIGVSLQIFIIKPPLEILPNKNNKKDNSYSSIEIFINPKIISISGIYKAETDNENLEGCLSLKGYYGPVKRAGQLTIEYASFDINLLKYQPKIIKTYKGFPAVIIQHEMDHLEGKIFVDRILQQKGKLYQVEKDLKGNEILNEVKI